ncbi:uncharacterized protein UPF0158 [Propionibacteriaceae bacterium ES.041]|uniref:UPF0158 family protein n=1 Tax=Enemella evansiae TaxID=2016499 RepID=UPI000B965AD4|nr:UPF0158 family protein [Enemella evansiae]OYO02260.1 hypothetical protein CGZ96_02640 [Enemella evansiae]PFG66966.1 uncharacterized protein UPF0158 [Propionibacteriaceae bacterium ES.041]
MANRWITVKVELLGGRGEILDPPPGRVLILPPRLTFDQLGEAIDLALGRWDLAHLRLFQLADGTIVTDDESAAELKASPRGAGIGQTLSLESSIARRIHKGEEFGYVFDLGDEWTHRCTVLGTRDPFDEVGHLPTEPVAIWGWGSLPDQYGRVTSDLYDEPDEPSTITYPAERPLGRADDALEPIDLRQARAAIAAADVPALLEVTTGVRLDHVLQQLGSGVLTMWPKVTGRQAAPFQLLALAIHNRLQNRQQLGDRELAAELLAALRGADPTEGVLVSLDELNSALSDDPQYERGAYLNRRTGEAIPPVLTDAGMVGEDAAVDIEADDWVHIDLEGKESDWQAMADFVATIADDRVRHRLEDAIEGKGAFSRFRKSLPEELFPDWQAFNTDRRWGRLRAELAYLDKNLHGR